MKTVLRIAAALVLATGLTWSRTSGALGTPAPLAPADDAVRVPFNNDGTITLTWGSVPGAESYEVQIGTPATVLVIPMDFPGGMDTTRAIANLYAGNIYSWRVRAHNVNGDGDWSALQTFTIAPLLAPDLQAPADNANSIASKPSINFTWNDNNPPPIPPIPGGPTTYTYRLQVATDNTFPNLPVVMIGLPASAPYVVDYTFTGLSGTAQSSAQTNFTYGKTYYWRVLTTYGTATSEWSAVRSFTTALPPPTSITLLTPANGSINVADMPLFTWADSARPTFSIGPAMPSNPSPYQLRLATDSTFPDAPPGPGGAGTPPYIFNGMATDMKVGIATALNHGQKYYWRVMVPDSYNGNGSYASGSFTVVPDPPDVPVQVGPPDNAVNVPLNTPLTWQAAARAVTYRVQISNNHDFIDPKTITEANTAGLSQSFSLSSSSTYFWRLWAENGGGHSAFTPIHQFTTVPPPPAAAPILTSPTDGSANLPVSIVYTWTSLSDALNYQIQVATDAAFQTLIQNDSAVAALTASGTGPKGATLHWRVRGLNLGGPGPWSTPFSFSVAPPVPNAPVPLSPATAINVVLTPTLIWSKPAFAASFDVQVAKDGAFTDLVLDKTGLTDTSFAAASLARNQTYYWRVRSDNYSGSSDWSVLGIFTTIPEVPAAPALLAPDDSARNLAVTGVVLKIAAVSGAAGYDFQVASDTGFTALAANDSLFAGLEHPIAFLPMGQTFHWRARARNAGGLGPWSAVRTFSTIPPIPSMPALLSPVANAVNLPVTPTLVCGKVPGADSYIFKTVKVILNNGNPSFVTVDSAVVSDTVHAVGPLEQGQTYLWGVSARNAGGASGSNTSGFTTQYAMPGPVALVYPASGDTVRGDSLVARWRPDSPSVFRYKLQVSSDSAFTSSATDSLIFDTTRSIRYAAANGVYWWRVQACNFSGCGPYGEARWFKVDNSVTALATTLRLGSGAPGAFRYWLLGASHVTISLYDARGRLRFRPVDETQSAGPHDLPIDPLWARGWYVMRFKAEPLSR